MNGEDAPIFARDYNKNSTIHKIHSPLTEYKGVNLARCLWKLRRMAGLELYQLAITAGITFVAHPRQLQQYRTIVFDRFARATA
jgi:hypothetical protein